MSKTINLGAVTAYADAVAAGYTGTREEFAQDLANAATYAAESHADAEAASDAAETATAAASAASLDADAAHDDAATAHSDAEAALSFKQAAETAATTATTKAGEATNSASQAATSASGAAGSATAASGSATAAAGSATNAAGSASAAAQTLVDVNAAGATQVAAIAAKGEEVLESIPSDYTELSNDVDDLKSAFDAITTEESISETETEYYTTPWTSGGGVNANGEIVSVGTWAYTDKIPVQKGDYITCDRLSGSNNRVSANIRYLCAYNGDTVVPSAGSSAELADYTVPEGVTHIVVTQASFTSYTGQRVVITRTVSTSSIWLKQNKIGGFHQTGNLNSGDEFTFPITNVKQYKVFAFSGNITSFSSVKMGRSVNGVDKESVSVDATNIVIANTYGSTTTIPHGLTIENDIQILLKTAERNRLSLVRVTSNGISFEYTENLHNITWNGDKGYPFARSVGSTLTNCSASWTSRRINSPMWLFGDSYMSYDTARWAYYLTQDGYDEQCLLNAYAGENSQNALIAFNSLISNGRPKYIVWALGMNDGDAVSDNAPNGNWLNALNSVIAVCEGRDIELILCTIPTTSVINNNYKNAWIRNSGYRYIDFANAVGADSSGNWFSGMLSSDNVHPTAQGAKALYGRVLTDFPEITVSN